MCGGGRWTLRRCMFLWGGRGTPGRLMPPRSQVSHRFPTFSLWQTEKGFCSGQEFVQKCPFWRAPTLTNCNVCRWFECAQVLLPLGKQFAIYLIGITCLLSAAFNWVRNLKPNHFESFGRVAGLQLAHPPQDWQWQFAILQQLLAVHSIPFHCWLSMFLPWCHPRFWYPKT